jgi:hypothetical protein
MSREKFLNYGLAIFFFLLPWQTRWIYAYEFIEGQTFEFGKLSLYATQLFLLALFFLTGKVQLEEKNEKIFRIGLIGLLAVLPGFFLAANLTIALHAAFLLSTAFALLLLLLDERVDLHFQAGSFIAGLIPASLLGIWQVWSGISPASTWFGLPMHDAARLGEAVTGFFGDRTLRAHAGFSHPNILGGYLSVGLLALAWLATTTKSIWQRRSLLLLSPLLLFTLFLTFSQSAWLGLALGVTLALLVYKMKGNKESKIAVMIIAALVIVSAYAYMIGTSVQVSTDALELETRSSQERIDMIVEYPSVMSPASWLIGNGIGNYTIALADVHPDRQWWAYQPIHNVPLLMIGEIGLLGCVLFLIFLSRIDILNFSRFPNVDAIAAFAMGNVLLLIAFFDHYLWSSWSGLTLAVFVLALTIRLGQNYGRK